MNQTPEFIDVKFIADWLGVSTSHVNRLAKAGKMPPAIKLGHLARWRHQEIRQWIDAGCPAAEISAVK